MKLLQVKISMNQLVEILDQSQTQMKILKNIQSLQEEKYTLGFPQNQTVISIQVMLKPLDSILLSQLNMEVIHIFDLMILTHVKKIKNLSIILKRTQHGQVTNPSKSLHPQIISKNFLIWLYLSLKKIRLMSATKLLRICRNTGMQ